MTETEEITYISFARKSFPATAKGAHDARKWGINRIEQFALRKPVTEDIPEEVNLEDIPNLRTGIWPEQDLPTELTLSELTGNVPRHAVPPTKNLVVDLSVVTQPPERKGDLRISVSDARRDFGPRTPPTLSATNGHGLELIEKLTTDFGVKTGGRTHGKTVFAEVGPVQNAA